MARVSGRQNDRITKVLRGQARKVTHQAYTAALESGHPVTVVRDGWICRVSKSGSVVRIRAIETAPDLRGRTFAL